MLRKYNYNLETGTIGTNDDNIANILYNINRMEMDKFYSSDDLKEIDEDLGELFFMIAESRVHLNRFLKISGEKVKPETVQTVSAALENATQTVRESRLDGRMNEANTEQLCTVFTTVYENLLAIVPAVLELDDQAVGRV